MRRPIVVSPRPGSAGLPMARLLLLLLLTASTALAQNRTRTVDNNLGAPTGPFVYTTFAAAEATSVDGDTIQFVPSETTYGNITLSRRLTVRGSNFRVRPEQGGHVVRVGGVDFRQSSDPQDPRDPSGSTFQGLIIDQSFNGDGTPVFLNNLTIDNCRTNVIRGSGGAGSSRISNLLITRSIIGGMVFGGGGAPNMVIRNSIFFQPVYIGQSTTFNTLDHNLFAGSSFLYGNNGIVSNNIFLVPVSSDQVITSTVFTNNLSFATSGTALPVPHPTNSGTGNLVNVNPLLVNFPTTTTLATVLTTDFRLRPGSPAIGAASDGTDIGPTGGATPFTSFFTGGAPVPTVSVLNVSPVVFTGSPLTVALEAVGALGPPAVAADAPPGLTGTLDEAFGTPAPPAETTREAVRPRRETRPAARSQTDG